MSEPKAVVAGTGLIQDAGSTSSAKRTYPLVLVCLLLAAGICVWVLQRTWVVVSVAEPGLPVQTESASGSNLYPASLAGAWLALACVVAIVATRGRWRRVVGVVVLLAAVATMVSAVAFPLTDRIEFASTSLGSRPNVQVSTTGWWIVIAVASLVTFCCGLAVLRWSSQWRSLSSRQAGTTPPELSDWEKLDRGLDPSAPAEPERPHVDPDRRQEATGSEPDARAEPVAEQDS